MVSSLFIFLYFQEISYDQNLKFSHKNVCIYVWPNLTPRPLIPDDGYIFSHSFSHFIQIERL